MESYAQVLNYAIPFFTLLILIEFIIGRFMGRTTIRSMDTISSLSSGMTNIIKDVLKLTVVIVSYDWMVSNLALFEIEATWALVLIAFVGKDFAGYWNHRIEHVVNVFWNRHIIHHSSEEFNLACALRQSISGITSIFVIFYLPMAILGVPTEIIAIVAPIHLFSQFWYHTTLINKMGFLEYIIVTPSHHRVHHAINPEYLDKNYSQIFIIWDKIFGTFQPELKDVPPVYGVKVPVQTWNPFLISIKHIWGIAKDAWRTRNIWDKIRIWFMPTGWRPDDVKAKYPIEYTEDPYAQVKYNPEASVSLQIWSWVQLLINLTLMLYLFSQIADVTFYQALMYAGFLAVSIFSYTTLMDRSIHALWLEGIKVAIGFYLMYYMEGWFFLDNALPSGSVFIGAYLIISLLVVAAFVILDIRKDEVSVSEAS